MKRPKNVPKKVWRRCSKLQRQVIIQHERMHVLARMGAMPVPVPMRIALTPTPENFGEYLLSMLPERLARALTPEEVQVLRHDYAAALRPIFASRKP